MRVERAVAVAVAIWRICGNLGGGCGGARPTWCWAGEGGIPKRFNPSLSWRGTRVALARGTWGDKTGQSVGPAALLLSGGTSFFFLFLFFIFALPEMDCGPTLVRASFSVERGKKEGENWLGVVGCGRSMRGVGDGGSGWCDNIRAGCGSVINLILLLYLANHKCDLAADEPRLHGTIIDGELCSRTGRTRRRGSRRWVAGWCTSTGRGCVASSPCREH